MAARSQPPVRQRKRKRLAVAAALLVALGVPTAAQAHSGAPVSSLDYLARVESIGHRRANVTASVVDGDRKLRLRVGRGSTVVVLGDAGEPFLRISPSGVAVNERSPTAIAIKLAPRGSVPALSPQASPSWKVLSDGSSYAWHDHRLGPVPGHVYREGESTTWAIPIVIDGRADRIVGKLSYASGPAPWPWAALFCVALVLAVALVAHRRRPRLVGVALVVGAAVAGAAAIVLSVGVSLVPGKSGSAVWERAAIAGAIAALAVGAFVRARRARSAIAGFVAVLAVLIGLGDVGVLVHGYVISSLPAWVVRAATASAIGVGLIAAACAARVLFRGDVDAGTRRRPPAPTRRPMVVPRQNARTR